ncbi:hypothetical protein SEVIR_9G067150v4 [Setaria viridis]
MGAAQRPGRQRSAGRGWPPGACHAVCSARSAKGDRRQTSFRRRPRRKEASRAGAAPEHGSATTREDQHQYARRCRAQRARLLRSRRWDCTCEKLLLRTILRLVFSD